MKRLLPLLVLACGWVAADARAESRTDNWVYWRGPLQTGWSPDRDLPTHWSPNPKKEGSNCLWTEPYGGRSTPLVMNGRVYIIDDAGEGLREQERVACFDAETGKVLWEHRFNVFFTDIVSARVGWASLAGDPETGNVYAHGVQGLFFCFDKDGKVLWQHSLTEEYGRISGYGGRVNSPIVDGDLVIMGMVNASWGDQARGGNRFVAFDKHNGTPVWWSQPTEQVRGTYSSIPVVKVMNGQRLLITGTSDGQVVALQVRTGVPVWHYQVGAKSLNISPVVEGTHVYIGHGEENLDTTEQGRIVCLDAAQVEHGQPHLVWKVDGITLKYVSPIVHEGRLYVTDENARLFCLNAETGKRLWMHKYGRSSFGSPVLADGKIYVGEAGGAFHILQPKDKGCESLHRVVLRSADGSATEINGSPAVANGRIYFTTSDAIYCIGKKDHKAEPVTLPQEPAEAQPNGGDKPAHLLLYPAEVALHAGGSIEFKLRAFDALGRPLGERDGDPWTLPAPKPPPGAKTAPPALRGTINRGRLVVAKEVPGQFGTVLTKVGELAAHARVRVVPTIPMKQDFEKPPVGAIPGGWVNAAGKFTIESRNGNKVLKKLANNSNPLLARAHTFFGMPDSTDYTIAADLMGTRKGSDMPDMGVIGNRYTLMLDGNKQRLRLLSWEALPRVDKTIPFEWKPNTWYRMKLTVDVHGDKAAVRGKVWEHGQSEPEAWTVEFDDPSPNKEGSPGLYGYATGILDPEPGAEIYYDNVQVTPNKK